MQKVTPVVTELKTAYDEACDTQLQEPTRVDNLEHMIMKMKNYQMGKS